MDLKPPRDLTLPWCALAVSMVFWGLFFTVLRTGKMWRGTRPLAFWTSTIILLVLALYCLNLSFELQPRI